MPMLRTTVIELNKYRHLKLVGLFTLAFLLFYWDPLSLFLSFQGEWFGYVTGTIAGLMVIVLISYGIRKRESKVFGSLRSWLSAHIYIGIALILVATIHTKFHFALNVHTLAYCLLVLVIVTGIYGIYAYLRFPRMMHENLGEGTLDAIYVQIANADKDIWKHMSNNMPNMPESIKRSINNACQDPIASSFIDQLRGVRPNCSMEKAIQTISLRCKTKDINIDEQKNCNQLLISLVQRRNMLAQVTVQVMYKARLRLWLYLHLPLSIGLIFSILSHVFFVLMFG